MKALIRSEWIKFRSVRSTLVTLGLAGAVVVLVAVLVARRLEGDSSPNVPVNLSELTGGVNFAALLFGVLGVQVIGQEYRFNTIRPTFTAAPNRIRVLVAKVVVVASACAAISLAMMGVCWVAGSVLLASFEVDGTDLRIIWATALFSALWSAAGMGVGAIVRQPIAGILVLLGESLVLEGLVSGLYPWTQRWLPFANGFQMTFRSGEGETQLRSTLEGGLFFALVVITIWAIGAWLVDRRDA